MSQYFDDPEQEEYFWDKRTWVDKQGKEHQLKDMSTSHIENVIYLIHRKGYAKQFQGSALENAILIELVSRDNDGV